MATTERPGVRVTVLLLLGGCGVFGPNAVQERSGAPFSLRGVRHALFMELPSSQPERGRGEAMLVMSSEKLDCDEVEDYVRGRTDRADWFLWSGDGLIAEFSWYADDDAGFEGEYLHGMYVIGGYDYYTGAPYTEDDYYAYYYEGKEPERPDLPPTRLVDSSVFADGSVYDQGGVAGRGEIESIASDRVRGELVTRYYKARFKAEACGSLSRGGGGEDSGRSVEGGDSR